MFESRGGRRIHRGYLLRFTYLGSPWVVEKEEEVVSKGGTQETEDSLSEN